MGKHANEAIYRELLRNERRDEPDPEHGYCIACECWVTPKRVDFGIGRYEYWGCIGRHHDWRDVCSECEGQLLDDEPIAGSDDWSAEQVEASAHFGT